MDALPNVLIVDDYKENLFLLERLIRKINVNLIIAESGIEALEKTQDMDLALAIIDVRMPAMDGYELAVKMNERSGAKVPVIFLTASHFSEAEMFKGFGLGAVDYIFKPIDNNFLLSKINVFLDLFRQRQIIERESVVLKKYADELARLNEALKKSEQKYRSYIDNAPDGVFVSDENGKYIEVNEAACKMTGYSEDQLLNMSVTDLVIFDEPQGKERDHKRQFFRETARQDLKFRHSDGSTRWLTLETANLSGTRYLGFIKDVTEQKNAEATQMHADRMINLGEMASGIAHEINQPLNIMSMILDRIIFESGKSGKVNIDFLNEKSEKIFDNINRIRNIIDHIRAFSRSQNDYVLSAFSINTSIENAASMIREQFLHGGINLDLQLDDQLPQINGNTYRFEQVIVNLLANAKDAVTERKSFDADYNQMRIGVRSYFEDETIIVEISDNGIGISDGDIGKAVLPFYTTKEEGKGTGLGLSICYQILKEMGGSINIESKRLSGTKISLKIEIQKKE